MSTVSRSVLVRLRAEMAQFKQEWDRGTGAVRGTREELARAERQSRQTGKSISELDSVVARTGARMKGYRQEWDQVGTSLLRTGAVITTASVLMGKAAMDWETAWTGVLKTVDGTPEQLAAVEEGIRDLAKSMPESHENIAAVAEAAGQLGVATEDIVDFTRVMVMLGDTTNLSADEAATSIAQLMNVMQTAPEDVDRLGATLVDLGNKGASTERDIVQMAQRIAGAGEIVGLSEANVLAVANALASSGIEVEAGGSAISNVLIDIAKAVDTGSDKLGGFAEVAGTTADDFAARWKADPATALADFTEGLGQMAANGDDVFSTLQGLGQTDIRVTRALLNMANAGDLLRNSLRDGDAAWEDNTALVEEAGKRYDTTAAQAEIAWNNIKDNAIDAGQGILPIVSALSDVVVLLGSAFGALPDPIKGSLGPLALLTGGALLTVGGLMKAASAASDFSDALKALEARPGRAAGAVTKLTKATTLLVGALALLEGSSMLMSGEGGTPEVNAFADALLKAADGGDAARESLNKLASADGTNFLGVFPVASGVNGIAEAFDIAAQKNLAALAPYETSVEKGRSLVEKIDESLASFVQSDNVEAATKVLAMLSDETGKSVDELTKQLPKYEDALDGVKVEQQLTAGTSDELAQATTELDRRLAELGGGDDAMKMLDELRAKSNDAASAFIDTAKDIDKGVTQWSNSLANQVKAMESWADNMLKATNRGVSQGVLDEFERMGPEGAKLLAELVDGSQAEIDRLNEIWGDYTDGTSRYSDARQGIRAEVLTEFKTAGAEDAIETAIEVATKYGLSPDQVETILRALDYASDDIDEVMDGLEWVDGRAVTAEVAAETEAAKELIDGVRAALDAINPLKTVTIRTVLEGANLGASVGLVGEPRADGGPIAGVGGPKQDNILIAASSGEHMWTAREVENVGGHGAMYAMRAMARAGHRPRFADGGAISDAWDQSFRTAAAAFGAPVASVAASSQSGMSDVLVESNLRGAKIEVGRDGLLRFVDGVVQTRIKSQGRWQSGNRTQMRGQSDR